jgi:hypothetical protein
MTCMVFPVALLTLLAAAADPVPRYANTFELELRSGRAELEWINTGAFRFTHVKEYDRSRKPVNEERVDVACSTEAQGYTCRTRHIVVRISDSGAVQVETPGGKKLLAPDTGAGERFYGLGARNSPRLDLNGQRIETSNGLLISTAGYGEYRPSACVYDFTGPRRSVECEGDYYFYYGPTPKEILESHAMVEPTEARPQWLVWPRRERRTWKDLRENIYAVQHASMSGEAGAPFVLGGYEGEALERARQIAALMPVVHAPGAAQPELRKRLQPYLETYAWEARDLGIPIIRPLAMQFPEDQAAAARTDVFMVGDEMLVAPVFDSASALKLYLPRGIWTELRTGEVYRGRQEIEIKAPPDWTPVFVRNGMIVPFAGEPLEMHYFPRLGGEFFLWEPDLDEISQFHAAPAAEFMRLESESARDRVFDWVVHHTPPCKRVTQGERVYRRVARREQLAPGAWMVDGDGVRIRVRASAGGDEIVHLEW